MNKANKNCTIRKISAKEQIEIMEDILFNSEVYLTYDDVLHYMTNALIQLYGNHHKLEREGISLEEETSFKKLLKRENAAR